MEDLLKDNKVVLNIENYNGDKPIELIVREGKAATQPDPLPTKAPIPVKFAGTLPSVTEWLGKRVSEIDQKHAFVKVDRENNTITLIINENDPYLKGEIQGTIAFTDDYKRIGINDPNKAWEPNKLGQFFRLNRAMFKDKESSMKLVSNLKNFTANAKTEIQKQKDPSGSRADVYKSQVESICLRASKSIWASSRVWQRQLLKSSLITTSQTENVTYNSFRQVARRLWMSMWHHVLTQSLIRSRRLRQT